MKCNKCDCELGIENGEVPFFVEETSYCPQDFVWYIAPTMSYSPDAFSAIKCTRCNVISVDCTGSGCCGHCGFRLTKALPHK